MGFTNRFIARFLALTLAFSTVHAPLAFADLHSEKAKKIGSATDFAYEMGVDIHSPMGKELIDILSSYPNMAEVSNQILGEQKFRVPFGPTFWRMILKPNSVSVLFMGQDGTHVAEAAGKTATAGFGGRAQDLARYLGVRVKAAFINAFAPTIKGQYGAFESAIVKEANGGKTVCFGSCVDNALWLMSQDQNSPLVQWRNSLIDWILRNNKDSLKLVVLFGGAARDSWATFVESKGGKVQARASEEDLKNTRVPIAELKPAGGNNEFPAVLTKDNKDYYEELVGRRLDYSKPEDVAAAQAALKSAMANKSSIEKLAIPEGGLNGSGIMHPAQIGGYDLSKMKVNANAEDSISMKGLSLSDGSRVENDVLVIQSPHPSALSKMTKEDASKTIARALQPLQKFVKQGWAIVPDSGLENEFAAGKPYVYGRSDIPLDYYDFGTPKNRMVPVSDASRLSGKPNVIVLGTRDKVMFDRNAIESMTKSKPTTAFSNDELFVARPRSEDLRYQYDAGPGEEFAKLMKQNIHMEQIGAAKPGSSFEKDGINAFNIKTHPEAVGDFGHYRGTFKNPRVLVLADPDGLDDLLTSRALTGARGQYLHGLLEDMKVGDQYLVLKTVPFGMDGATDKEWKTVLGQTQKYREEVIKALLSQGTPDVIIADGSYASLEIQRILGSQSKIPVVSIDKMKTENNSGIAEAARKISMLSKFRGLKFRGVMANIPRSHLTLLSRIWEGTGGSHVLDASTAKHKGLGFAIVAPEWAYRQKKELTVSERTLVEKMKSKLQELGLPLPGEKFSDYLSRRKAEKASRETEAVRAFQPAVQLKTSAQRSCERVFLQKAM